MFGLGLGLAAAWLNGWHFEQTAADDATASAVALPGPLARISNDNVLLGRLIGYMAFFAVPFFLMRWWKLTERGRARRFSLYPVLLAGIVAFLCTFIWPDHGRMNSPLDVQGAVALTLTAAIIQLVSPWEAPAPKPVRKARLRYT